MSNCKFCSCNHHARGSGVTFASSPRTRSVATGGHNSSFYTQKSTQTVSITSDPKVIYGTSHEPSRVYSQNGERLGRQISAGGGTTIEAVVFPRGDAFVQVEGRRHSPDPAREARGYVPANLVRDTSHRHFVQSLRAPGSYSCTQVASDCMRFEYPGPHVPESLRQRHADVTLMNKIHSNNAPKTRNAASRQKISSQAPDGPIMRLKQQPYPNKYLGDGKRRYDPPSSGIAARTVADQPVAPAARDLYAADEMNLRAPLNEREAEENYNLGPGFRTGVSDSAAGLCPSVDAKRAKANEKNTQKQNRPVSSGRRSNFSSGGGGGGGGGYGSTNPARAALSPSTIKPTRLTYDHGKKEMVEVEGEPLAALNRSTRHATASRRPNSPRAKQDAVDNKRIARPSSANDVAAWRRKYYPDGVHSVRRHFYEQEVDGACNNNGAPPVCDRCCCDCCCETECVNYGAGSSARHRPGATSDCLWWYGN